MFYYYVLSDLFFEFNIYIYLFHNTHKHLENIQYKINACNVHRPRVNTRSIVMPSMSTNTGGLGYFSM